MYYVAIKLFTVGFLDYLIRMLPFLRKKAIDLFNVGFACC